MKPVTRELGAGIVPAKMLEDGQLPSAAFVMFSALTLYAEPGGDWDEWELDFGNRGGMSAGTKAVCGNKAMMDKLATGGYIEELVWDGEVALFSFPDWVKELLRGGSNAAVGIGETRPEEKAEEETGEGPVVDEDEAEEQEVRRSAPAEGYTPKVFNGRKGEPECSECGRKIKKGEEYFWMGKGPRSPKVCRGCAPPDVVFHAPGTTPQGEGRREEPVAQSGEGESTCASSAFPIETGYVVAGGPGEVKAIFREALEEYMTGQGGSLVESLNRISETLPATTVLSVRELEREREQKEKIARILESIESSGSAEQSLHERIAASIDKLLAAQYTRHEGGTTVAELEELVREQDLIETALGVEITRRLDGDGFLSGPALRIIDTTARTVGEFLAERGICFTQNRGKGDDQNAQVCKEWHKIHPDLSSRAANTPLTPDPSPPGGEGRKEVEEGQG